MNVLVLGCGRIGSTMAMDLLSDARFEVTVADQSPPALEALRSRATGKLTTVAADLRDPQQVTALAAKHELVLGALASVLGLQTLRAVIEAGRPYVDVSFMADDPLTLGPLAEQRGVCAVVDCGVAPGMSNMLCGYATRQLQPCTHLEIYVGGLPVERRWPYEYQAGFAPHDVLEEYTRPSRLVENGRVVVREALTEPELLDFPGIGTLEAFNTDGLRSLIHTLQVPSMKEKTLRYPGHIALMRVLRETGFFGKEGIAVDSPDGGRVRVRPLDMTAALLFPKWAYQPGEADLTVMRVAAEGLRDGKPLRLAWDLFDRHDPVSDTRSMSRTTAFPAVIVARLLAERRFVRPGVHPPEVLGQEPGFLDAVLSQLQRRGVRFTAREE